MGPFGRPPELDFRILAKPNQIEIVISDDGPGIPPQVIENFKKLIFNKLVQEAFKNCPEWDEDYYAHSVSLNRLSIEKSLLDRQVYKHKEISLEDELKFLGL